MTEDILINHLRDLFDGLGNETDRTIAIQRTFALANPATLEQLGNVLGVTRERVRQREASVKQRAISKKMALAGELSQEVSSFAHRVGDGLIQHEALEALPDSLAGSGTFKEASVPLLVFLYLAGPFELWGDLLVQQTLRTKINSLSSQSWATLRHRKMLTVENADEFADWHDITSPDIVNQVLADIQSEHPHVSHLSGGVYIYEPKASDRATRALEEQNSPLDLDQLAQICSVSPRTLLNYIKQDERLVRLDRNVYGLKKWGHHEYDGVVGSIHKALAAMGGTGHLEDIADWVTENFDVSWNSVISYACSHHDFITVNGNVRLRKPDELIDLIASRDLGEVGDCLEIDGYPTLRVAIDATLWRGSGSPVPRPWAIKLGLRPGQKLTFLAGKEHINLSWIGKEPALGSLRTIALENNWPRRGVAFLTLVESGVELTWKHYPPEPSEDVSSVARAMSRLFAFSEISQGHPLGGSFWVILGERLGLPPQYRVPGMVLARLRSRREKIVEPYVQALEHSFLLSEAHGLVVQVDA